MDYDLALGGVGGVGVLALEAVVSGASSDGTLSEGGSSVVLDPGVRRVGLPQDYPDPDTLRDSPVMATPDTRAGLTPNPEKPLFTNTHIPVPLETLVNKLRSALLTCCIFRL